MRHPIATRCVASERLWSLIAGTPLGFGTPPTEQSYLAMMVGGGARASYSDGPGSVYLPNPRLCREATINLNVTVGYDLAGPSDHFQSLEERSPEKKP
jgi:hypothetical protein